MRRFGVPDFDVVEVAVLAAHAHFDLIFSQDTFSAKYLLRVDRRRYLALVGQGELGPIRTETVSSVMEVS